MARRLLIVEDSDGVALLLGEIASQLGLTPDRAKSGGEAAGKLAPLPDAVVCDLVLGDGDGFSVAKALRALPGGDQVPLIVVSGVYRALPPPFADEVRPVFLAKPFDPDRLREVLEGELAKVDLARGLKRGRFVGRSPASLLVELYGEKATGVVDLALGETRRRLVLDQGLIRFAQSTVGSESLAHLALESGALAKEALDRAIEKAKAEHLALHDALVAAGAMTKEAAWRALVKQTALVTKGALAMLGAEWLFQAQPVDAQPEARCHPVAALAEAAKGESPEDARTALAHHGEARAAPGPLLSRELNLLRGYWPGETVTDLVGARPTCAELVEKARPGDLPLAWALVDGGLVVLEKPVAAGAAREEDELDRGKSFSNEEIEARRTVFAERERLREKSHYQRLGVDAKATAEEIRAAFREAARRYHSDRYAGLDLGSASKALAELFQQANEAMAVLGDEKARADYDIYLERRAAGLPTDVGEILEAEQLFLKGQALARAGKFAEALSALREAVKKNHAEAEFHAWLGYALVRVEGPKAADEAKRELARALELQPLLASAWRLSGLAQRELGDLAEAERALKKAMEIDPKDGESARALEELRDRPRKDGEGKGLFGRLFRKAK